MTLAGTLVAVFGALGGVAGGDAAEGGDRLQLPAPPRPYVVSHSRQLAAALGSYCWDETAGESTGGGGEGPSMPGAVCVDVRGYPRTRRSLPVHPGGRVLVDLRHAGQSLAVETIDGDSYGRAVQVDAEGRRWRFRVPRRERRRHRDVLVDATYAEGDASFGFRVSVHRHRRR